MPRKEFESFTRLDASDVNTYLMDQSVMTFGGTAARGSAIATPVEGMVTYLEDSDSFEYWDSAEWTSLAPAAPSGNAIINGAFEINQRNFTSTSTNNDFGFDRWQLALSGATGTYSAQTFTPGTAPIAGYEAKNFARLAITTGNDNARIQQRIESVRTFAGQTVTLSFFAKGTNPATTGNLAATFTQVFGSGGTPSAENTLPEQTFVLTSNWTRYSLTFEIPSISGKTIGTDNNDYLGLYLWQGSSISTDAWTLDLWGVQVESGAVANVFRRNANSLQGELAACQRYYQRVTAGGTFGSVSLQGAAISTTAARIFFPLKTTLRTKASVVEFGNVTLNDGAATPAAGTITLGGDNPEVQTLTCTTTGLTQFRPYILSGSNNAAGFIAISAEL